MVHSFINLVPNERIGNVNYKTLSLSFFMVLFASNAYSEEFEVQSPNKISKFKINIGESISYSVFFKENLILLNSSFSLEFAQGAAYEKDFIVEQKIQNEIDELWKPLFGKHSVIRNHCNELKLILRKKNPGTNAGIDIQSI
jgi:Glycosyl-hydrolase 97 N-terminal